MVNSLEFPTIYDYCTHSFVILSVTPISCNQQNSSSQTSKTQSDTPLYLGNRSKVRDLTLLTRLAKRKIFGVKRKSINSTTHPLLSHHSPSNTGGSIGISPFFPNFPFCLINFINEKKRKCFSLLFLSFPHPLPLSTAQICY